MELAAEEKDKGNAAFKAAKWVFLAFFSFFAPNLYRKRMSYIDM